MQNAAPEGSGAVQLAGNERVLSIKSTPLSQPDSVAQHRALHLIEAFNVRPEMALTLASLAFGGAE